MENVDVRDYLPQRYPFLLVDRVVEMEEGKYIEVVKNVTQNEPHFTGHFPEQPIMPGVLIIEAMAQAAGVLGFKSQNKKPSDGYNYLLCGTDKTRFKRQVVPGDQLLLKATLITVKRGIFKFFCEATVDGELVASAELIVAEQKV